MVMEVKDVLFSQENGRIALRCVANSREVMATILNNENLPSEGDMVNVCESTSRKYYGFSAVAKSI